MKLEFRQLPETISELQLLAACGRPRRDLLAPVAIPDETLEVYASWATKIVVGVALQRIPVVVLFTSMNTRTNYSVRSMNIKAFPFYAALLVSGCGDPVSQSKAMLAEKIECPAGSRLEIQRWGGIGEDGWMKSCKMFHGTFTAWHGETKAVQGEYVNGQEEGVWVFWNRAGKKVKEITFKGGNEISVLEY